MDSRLATSGKLQTLHSNTGAVSDDLKGFLRRDLPHGVLVPLLVGKVLAAGVAAQAVRAEAAVVVAEITQDQLDLARTRTGRKHRVRLHLVRPLA